MLKIGADDACLITQNEQLKIEIWCLKTHMSLGELKHNSTGTFAQLPLIDCNR